MQTHEHSLTFSLPELGNGIKPTISPKKIAWHGAYIHHESLWKRVTPGYVAWEYCMKENHFDSHFFLPSIAISPIIQGVINKRVHADRGCLK